MLLSKIMKPILPSLRENNRYVEFSVNSEKKLNTKDIENMLEEQFLTFLGKLELAKSSFKLVKFSGNKGIIKVNAKYADKIRAMFTMIKEMNIKSTKTSGLLNKLKEE